MYRYLTGHPWLLPVAVALVLVGGVGGAFAAYPENSVTQYTGCLNTGGAAGGSLSGVAVGDSPAKACGPNQIVAHLSGGDITAVRTPPGSGLSGGTENGAATLSLASGFSLPQSCSDAQIPVWSGTNTAWACGSDNNTTYSNGTGLDLSSGNAFSVSPPYRLPQNCASGQAPQSTEQHLDVRELRQRRRCRRRQQGLLDWHRRLRRQHPRLPRRLSPNRRRLLGGKPADPADLTKPRHRYFRRLESDRLLGTLRQRSLHDLRRLPQNDLTTNNRRRARP